MLQILLYPQQQYKYHILVVTITYIRNFHWNSYSSFSVLPFPFYAVVTCLILSLASSLLNIQYASFNVLPFPFYAVATCLILSLASSLLNIQYASFSVLPFPFYAVVTCLIFSFACSLLNIQYASFSVLPFPFYAVVACLIFSPACSLLNIQQVRQIFQSWQQACQFAVNSFPADTHQQCSQHLCLPTCCCVDLPHTPLLSLLSFLQSFHHSFHRFSSSLTDINLFLLTIPMLFSYRILLLFITCTRIQLSSQTF